MGCCNGLQPAPGYQDELELLLEVATGAKAFRQLRKDALKAHFPGAALKQAVRSNASRGAAKRLHELTGVSKGSLHHFQLRCKPDAATAEDGTMPHPFFVVSSMVEKLLATDEYFC